MMRCIRIINYLYWWRQSALQHISIASQCRIYIYDTDSACLYHTKVYI